MDNNEFNVFIEEYEKHFDIISNCNNFVDVKWLNLSSIDITFLSIKANGAAQYKTKTNPDRHLIRYQFLEMFVRLAIERFYDCKRQIYILISM